MFSFSVTNAQQTEKQILTPSKLQDKIQNIKTELIPNSKVNDTISIVLSSAKKMQILTTLTEIVEPVNMFFFPKLSLNGSIINVELKKIKSLEFKSSIPLEISDSYIKDLKVEIIDDK